MNETNSELQIKRYIYKNDDQKSDINAVFLSCGYYDNVDVIKKLVDALHEDFPGYPEEHIRIVTISPAESSTICRYLGIRGVVKGKIPETYAELPI